MTISDDSTVCLKEFDGFEVFGDYAPLGAFHSVFRLRIPLDDKKRALGIRADKEEDLDPGFAQMVIRAGVSLAKEQGVSFVYANSEESLILISGSVCRMPGEAARTKDRLTSLFAARVARLAGMDLPLETSIYELPSLSVVHRLFGSLIESHKTQMVGRSVQRLVAQLSGRGEIVSTDDLVNEERQMRFLKSKGVALDCLPSWWRTGLAATSTEGSIDIVDPLPSNEDLQGLIVG